MTANKKDDPSKIEKPRGKVENLTNAGKGRKKGSKNILTRTALEAISYAADQLGGADRLVDWVKEDPANEKVFWGTIYPKLLPLQLTGDGGGNVIIQLSSTDAKL